MNPNKSGQTAFRYLEFGDLFPAVLKIICDFVLAPPGGPGGGSGLQLSSGNIACGADFGPNPRGDSIFNFDFGPKRSWLLAGAKLPARRRRTEEGRTKGQLPGAAARQSLLEVVTKADARHYHLKGLGT